MSGEPKPGTILTWEIKGLCPQCGKKLRLTQDQPQGKCPGCHTTIGGSVALYLPGD